MTSSNIVNKRSKLVNNWFINLKNNTINDDVLLVICDMIDRNSIEKLKKYINKNYLNELENKPDYDIFAINNIPKERLNYKLNSIRNTIIIGDKASTLSSLRNVKNKMLFITVKNNPCNILQVDYVAMEYQKVEITDDEHFLLHIEEKSPLEIIQKSSSEIQNLIFNSHADALFIKEATLNSLLRDTNLTGTITELIDKKVKIILADENSKHTVPSDTLRIKESAQHEYIKRDIAILKEKNILTSRLSIVIYRKSFLDSDANITEIGLYFSKAFGRKSKIVDLKKISKNSSVDYNGLSKTTVKAYDMNITGKSENQIRMELEKEIKENIAKKLFYFTNIEIDIIQRIVELPMSTLKKYR